LIKSLQRLRGNEKAGFYVIFYDDAECPIREPNLIRATRENIDRAIGWIQSVNGGGGTDPTAAMQRALRLNPDTIWLLSDGCFPDQVADFVRAENPQKKVHINTIAFHDPSGEQVLRRIAQENKGDFRFVPGPPEPGNIPMPMPSRRATRRPPYKR
jgi:uncharacterized protein with von Willebrand factor type A (vWA) domain